MSWTESIWATCKVSTRTPADYTRDCASLLTVVMFAFQMNRTINKTHCRMSWLTLHLTPGWSSMTLCKNYSFVYFRKIKQVHAKCATDFNNYFLILVFHTIFLYWTHFIIRDSSVTGMNKGPVSITGDSCRFLNLLIQLFCFTAKWPLGE